MTDAAEWQGRVGDAWAEEWRRTDRSFAPVDAALVEAAAESHPSTILDIGCGAGGTSLALAARLPAARVTGVDLSPALVAAANARDATGRCTFVVGDAARWAEQGGFEQIVSRHGVMFFGDPVAAFAHIRGRAAPGAPLAFSCFRAPALNPWASEITALLPPAESDPRAPGPFAFADTDYVATILADAGWRDAAAEPLDYDYVAGAGDDPVADAVALFRRIGPGARALRGVEGADRARLLDAIAELCHKHLAGGRVSFAAAAWIWRARA